MTEAETDARTGGMWRSLRAPIVVVVLLVLATFAVRHLAQDVSYGELTSALSEISLRSLALAFLFTGLSFLALSLSDLSGLEYAGRRLPYGFVALTSFCAHAVANTAGFGPLSGGAVRYRFYTPLGLAPDEIARAVVFMTAGFALGLATTEGISLLIAGDALADILNMAPAWLRLAGMLLLVAALAPIFAPLCGSRMLPLGSIRFPLPRTGLALRQIAITLVDVSASATVLWVLLPDGAIGLPTFVAIYSVAVGLGMLSHVPAGLGVFETVVMASLHGAIAPVRVLGALVLYRLVYHALPLAAAAVLILALETRRVLSGPGATRLVMVAGRLAPPVLASLCLMTGAMLVLSGLTPLPTGRVELLAAFVPLPVVEGANFLSSVLGTILLVSARGLLFRLDGAWWITVGAATLALLFALLKALAVFEALVLCLLIGGLVLSRVQFARPSSLAHGRLSARWAVAVATVLVTAVAVMFFAYREVQYTHELWWQFEFAGDAPRSLRALVGVMLATAMVAIWSLMKPWQGVSAKPTPGELARAVAIAASQTRAEANLVRMGDKSLMFSEAGDAFIMFARQGRSWIALFDPVGREEAWPGLVWKFVETARQSSGRAVFYEIGPDHLALYADAGLYAFRLGESARVNLAGFDLQGSRRAPLRNARRKGERAGLEVEIVAPERVPEILDELACVSDAWLETHDVREKGFSLGAFDRRYVALQPVACLKQNGRIIAFATVLTTELRYTVSLDLIRLKPDAPNGAMDFLFVELLLHFKEQGYAWFELGMAPLAGFHVGSTPTFWNRVGRAVFDHGERFYHFRGLHSFKDKFDPQWRPCYMAVSGGINPLIALTDVTALIGGGLRGVVSK